MYATLRPADIRRSARGEAKATARAAAAARTASLADLRAYRAGRTFTPTPAAAA